jgi:ribosomal protein S6
MVINVEGKEYFIEAKKYYSPRKFEKGKKQLAYYVKKAGLKEGVYIVFLRDNLHEDLPNNNIETIDDSIIKTYIIRYDEEKDF